MFFANLNFQFLTNPMPKSQCEHKRKTYPYWMCEDCRLTKAYIPPLTPTSSFTEEQKELLKRFEHHYLTILDPIYDLIYSLLEAKEAQVRQEYEGMEMGLKDFLVHQKKSLQKINKAFEIVEKSNDTENTRKAGVSENSQESSEKPKRSEEQPKLCANKSCPQSVIESLRNSPSTHWHNYDQPQPEPAEDWEEDFDKKFDLWQPCNGITGTKNKIPGGYRSVNQDVIQYFKSLLQKERGKFLCVMPSMEGKCKKIKYEKSEIGYCYDHYFWEEYEPVGTLVQEDTSPTEAEIRQEERERCAGILENLRKDEDYADHFGRDMRKYAEQAGWNYALYQAKNEILNSQDEKETTIIFKPD
jgi:hypothetical protein